MRAVTLPTMTSLADFESMALDRHPLLRMAAARINEARGDQRQAGLWPNPMVGYSGEEMGNRGNNRMQSGFVWQKFVMGRKLNLGPSRWPPGRGARTAAPGKGVPDTSSQWRSVRYYDTLVAQQRVELTRKMSQLGEELAQATARLVEAKQVSANSLLLSEISAEQGRAMLGNSRNELIEARRLLAFSVGDIDLKVGELDGNVTADLPDMTWEDCRKLVLDDHPALAAARVRLSTAGEERNRQKRLVVPDIDLRVGVGHMDVTGSDVTSVRVGVPLPIFDRNQGGIARSEAELIRARFGVERLEIELHQRAAVAFREYSNARQQTRRYSAEILPRASRSLRLVRRGYSQGQVPYLELLVAQQKFIEVNLSYLSSIRKLREAVTVIRSQLLTSGLHGHRKSIDR
ncbi:MAG: RND transporter [Planctomycetaceae bacterium]|nr:MAG: RND transporter [Planctomycetaceae bacterium]